MAALESRWPLALLALFAAHRGGASAGEAAGALAGARVPEDAVVGCSDRAMQALASQGRWQEAFELAVELGRRGVEASGPRRESMISACERAGLWPEALHLLGRSGWRGVSAQAGALSKRRRNALCTLWARSQASVACAQSRRWRLPAQLLEEARAAGLEPSRDAVAEDLPIQ
ncbi:unnamed protein product [Prorocentrum cordatum]|uniref:Sel1 repeat family protein n=1 Tax=Prorocentrum cordatum TaxID=2364126 RepID=A0ABN9T6H4_9DINO|nr:unnamed protein product [Polarella glacialis]